MDGTTGVISRVHLQHCLSSLRKTHHTTSERHIPSSPDRVIRVNDGLGLWYMHVPHFDGLVQRAGDDFPHVVVRPVDTVDLGRVRANLRNGKRAFAPIPDEDFVGM